MTSFLHVLLLLALCVFGNQALNNQTGCPNGNANAQYNINEKLPIGTEVILFKNIKNITLPGTEFDVTKKGDEEYAVILKKLYVYDASNIGNNIKYVHFTCVPNHGPTIQGMLTVVLNNVIETPPDFGQSGNAHFNIPENSPSGTQVGKVNVEVTDGDTNTIVLFNLTKIGTPFTIDWPPNNTPRRYFKGVISVQYPELLDYETTPEYNLTVKATIAGTNLTSTTTVYINVIDVDDMFPRFDPSNEYNKTIPEKKYNRYEIATLLAEDEDTGPSKTQDINYSLIRAFPETSLFEVVNTTGQVLVTGTLDRETCDNYLLLLKAYQVDKPDLRMDVATLNVTVSDVDDNPPVMTQTSYEVRIPENTPKDVVVFAFTATDADKGKNAKFKYMIENQGSIDAFKIDSASGVLRVNNGSFLDRETHSNLTFSVLAESTQNSSIRSHEANVTIILLDENDNSPKFSSPFYTFTVNKNISSPWYIGAVYANDSDESNNGNVVYQLRGNESRRFTISKAGSINAIASLASDYQPWYRFTVTASDNAKFKRQTSVQVELQVIDVNVNKPYFMNMTKSISVQEDIDEGSELLIIQAYDEDPSDDLTFMLHNVSDFILKGVDTRKSKILINKALDRETRPDGYNLTVTVTDSLHTATATLSVTIEDVNDNAPVFQYPDHNFAVFEGVHNKVIGNVTATDQDIKNNGLLHYSIGPTWYGNFSITQTGEIMVISDLDRESLNATSGQIVLLVFVEDKGKPPLMATATATVQVKDINDHAPRFKNLEENITINEGQNISKHIQAYDEDEGKNGDIHYIIGHSNNSVLKVENDVLISSSPLTYGVYEVEVISYNTVPYTRTGLKNDNLTVYIHVKDVNNHEPQFNRTSYRFTLPEDFTVGHLVNRSVCEIYAEDKDETLEYNTVTYSMVDKDGYFEIDPRDASLRLIKPLDFEETKQVNFKVMATDGDPTHQQTVNVTVKIMNVNDNAPRFSSDIYDCSVEENSSQALDCTVPIRATDNDTAEDRLTFSIDGYMKDIFTINSTTGEIRPTSPLDADAGPSIYVTEIKVVDDGIPQYTGSAVVEVTVADKNDNSPVIHGPSHIAIPENLPINTTVATIFATDLDINDNLTFSLSTTDLTTDSPTTVNPVSTSPAPTTVIPANATTRSDIECESDLISLHVPLGLLPSGQQVTWNDPSCVVANNGTHLTGSIGLGDCGTYVVFNDSHVTFENELVSHAGPRAGTLEPQSGIDFGAMPNSVIVVQCVYPRREQESLAFRPVQGQVRFFEKTLGHMLVHMRQARDVTFADTYARQDEPRTVHLNDEVFIKLTTDQGNVTTVAINVDRCLATPSPSPLDTDFQELTNNGCPAISSVRIHNSPATEVHLSFHAFQFTSHPGAPVYIHCEVYVCPLSNPHCVTGCTNVVARSRRAATGGIKTHLVSTGPFPVTDEKEQGIVGQSTALIAVTGLCACLAVAATVFGIMAWRGRRRLTAKETVQ